MQGSNTQQCDTACTGLQVADELPDSQRLQHMQPHTIQHQHKTSSCCLLTSQVLMAGCDVGVKARGGAACKQQQQQRK